MSSTMSIFETRTRASTCVFRLKLIRYAGSFPRQAKNVIDQSSRERKIRIWASSAMRASLEAHEHTIYVVVFILFARAHEAPRRT